MATSPRSCRTSKTTVHFPKPLSRRGWFFGNLLDRGKPDWSCQASEVSLVTGPYDLIINLEADDLKELGRIVNEQVQTIPGVTKTITCVIIG